jgi:hypothetical protein
MIADNQLLALRRSAGFHWLGRLLMKLPDQLLNFGESSLEY